MLVVRVLIFASRLPIAEAILEPAALDSSTAASELPLDILPIFTYVFCESRMALSSPLSPVYSDLANKQVHLDGRGTQEADSYRA